MDEQTEQVRFESMRKSAAAGPGVISSSSSRRQLLITHAELSRQCRATVRGYEFDSRMSTSQLRQERKEAEARLARIKTDQIRCRKEHPKTLATLQRAQIQHERQKLSQLNHKEEIKRSEKQECQLDVDTMLSIVDSLPLPVSVKKHLEEPILSGTFRIKC